MSTERVVFGHTMEAMFLKAWPADDERLRRAYADAGLDVSKPLLAAYPYETWRKCFVAQAQLLLPDLAPAEARFRQGVRFMDSYFDTAVGKALLLIIKLIGPRRTLERMTRNMRSANNFSDAHLVELGPETFQLSVNDLFAEGPEYVIGFLQRGLELAGTPSRVTVRSTSGDSAVLLIDWSKQA